MSIMIPFLRPAPDSCSIRYGEKVYAEYKRKTGMCAYHAKRTDPILIDIVRSFPAEHDQSLSLCEIPELFKNHYEITEDIEGTESLRILVHKYQVETIALIHAKILIVITGEDDAATKLEKVSHLHAVIDVILQEKEIPYVY